MDGESNKLTDVWNIMKTENVSSVIRRMNKKTPIIRNSMGKRKPKPKIKHDHTKKLSKEYINFDQ